MSFEHLLLRKPCVQNPRASQILALFPNGALPQHGEKKGESACKRQLMEGFQYTPASLRTLCR